MKDESIVLAGDTPGAAPKTQPSTGIDISRFLENIKADQRKFVDFKWCQTIVVGLINYCDSLGASGFPQIEGVTLEGTDVAGFAGANEIIMTLQFQAERHPEWYKQLGLLSYVLAENPGGKYPRKVDLMIEYKEDFKKNRWLQIKIIVHLYVIKMSDDGGKTIEAIQ